MTLIFSFYLNLINLVSMQKESAYLKCILQIIKKDILRLFLFSFIFIFKNLL